MHFTVRKILHSQKNVSQLEERSHIAKYVTVRKVGPDWKNESNLEKLVTFSKMCQRLEKCATVRKMC